MISQADNLPMDEDDPLGLNASPTQEDLEWRAHLERVRQQCVAEFSSSPLYQAAALKDPEYWNEFSIGRVHLY